MAIDFKLLDYYDVIKNGEWLVDKEVWDRRKTSCDDVYGE